MDDAHYELQTFKVIRFFKDHPGLVISLSYLLLTACGLFYSANFYSEFDIAILKLANISDILTIGLSEPAAIITFAGGLLVAIFTDYVAKIQSDSYNKWKDRPQSFRRWLSVAFYSPKYNRLNLVWLIAIFFLYGEFFVSKYASLQADKIKAGRGDALFVQIADSAEPGQPFMLLGSTSNFLICYSLQKSAAVVLPMESVAKFSPTGSEDQPSNESEE